MGSVPQQMRLIVGLGNPDREYEGTRHNAGFMLIDKLLAKMPKGFEQIHTCQSYVWQGNYAGNRMLLQKPLTYMNLSGNAVAPLMRSEEIQPGEVLIVHDDMDIPLGHIRIRKGGGPGGHNGIKSLIEQIGTEAFWRVRIGVGHPEEGRSGVIDYVLSPFTEAEKAVFDRTLTGAVDAIILMLRRGPQQAMNEYNSRTWCEEEEPETINQKIK